MELKGDFETFLAKIRPTDNQLRELKEGHETLRERLTCDDRLSDIVISSFLQGSYRRSTAVRPVGDKKLDVDVVVVTNLAKNEISPQKAFDCFKPFLEQHYKGQYKLQGRSFGIELAHVNLDMVIALLPQNADHEIWSSDAVTSRVDLENARDWRLASNWVCSTKRYGVENSHSTATASYNAAELNSSSLLIPDREASEWCETNPIEQIKQIRNKNKSTNGHFVNVVKAIKWWLIEQKRGDTQPKSFPLERLIEECCPNEIDSVADGIVKTFKGFNLKYCDEKKPFLSDYGVPAHDVLKRLIDEEFSTFCELVFKAQEIAHKALCSLDKNESRQLWRELLGEKFPAPTSNGFTHPKKPSNPSSGRFA